MTRDSWHEEQRRAGSPDNPVRLAKEEEGRASWQRWGQKCLRGLVGLFDVADGPPSSSHQGSSIRLTWLPDALLRMGYLGEFKGMLSFTSGSTKGRSWEGKPCPLGHTQSLFTLLTPRTAPRSPDERHEHSSHRHGTSQLTSAFIRTELCGASGGLD